MKSHAARRPTVASRVGAVGPHHSRDAHLEWYRGIFANARECLLVLSVDGRVIEANPRVDECLTRRGRPRRGDFLWAARCWQGCDDAAERVEAAVRSAAAGARVRVETPVNVPRLTRTFEWSLTPIPDDGGGVAMILAEGRDLTERRQAEDALQDSREAALLAEASARLGASLDVGQLLELTAALLVPAVASFCVIEILGDTGRSRRIATLHRDRRRTGLTTLFRGYPRDPDRPYIGRTAATDRTTEYVERLSATRLHLLAQDEAYLEALRALNPRSYISAPLVAHESTIGVITVVRDATMPVFTGDDVLLVERLAHRAARAFDHALAHENALRAIRQRDEVMSIVTHDLRSPLGAITLNAQALEELTRGVGDTRVRQMLSTMNESVQWMDRLINDLVDVASIEGGRLSLELGFVEPATLVRRALQQFALAAEAGSIRLRAEVPEALPDFAGDADRLHQTLSNLLSNAVRLTPAGGEIVVRAEAGAETITFSVRDTGPGIPANEQHHIFDRFVHIRRGSSVRGTGLGLAIAKGIVEAHAGRIWVESVPGEGSCFLVRLPLMGPGTSPEQVRSAYRHR